MNIRVRLTYECRDGKKLEVPPGYPDEILFDLQSAGQVTSELVIAALYADLETHGTKALDVVVAWEAFDLRFGN